MIAYVFKLNVGPLVLKVYQNDFSQLKEVVIPSAFSRAFEQKFTKKSVYCFVLRDEYNEIVNSSEYKLLVKLNKSSKDFYEQVYQEYLKTRDIVYSHHYLENREDLRKCIEKLKGRFSVLEAADDIKLHEYFGEEIHDIGMNRKYIQKADKIEYFVENNLKKLVDSPLKFMYDGRFEYIYSNF